MFILEDPYVSELLASTAAAAGRPVLDTPAARRALSDRGVQLASDAEFAAAASAPGARVYSNSENAIGWIARHLTGTGLPQNIALFKDKFAFREIVSDLYPGYRYAGLDLAELRSFDPHSMGGPFVVKPAVGFFSMGVHVVASPAEWPATVAAIEREVESFARIYPTQVLELTRFIVEQAIEGDEYAVDAYFGSEGAPVLVNVYGHLFASADDVSDRVYYTSVELVDRLRDPILDFLAEVGRRTELRNFPIHAEVRIDSSGRVAPIEINPMRFGGWCATDLAYFAYGVNPYRCYLDDECPDWDAIARERAGRVTALVVADLPASVTLADIESVDYDSFAARFSRVLELRPTDYNRYPVFAFTFVDVPGDDLSELRAVLGADLTTYLRMK